LSDFVVTITCWIYFTLGFVFLYSIRYLVAYLFSSQREIDFQGLTSRFYRRFFQLLRRIAPCHQWRIDSRIAGLKSSVIVCNHLSYLDPILLISLLERQKTVVKTKFFKVPIFGWLIRNAGYFPADGEGKFARMMIEQVEQMEKYLAGGGNLFVFPEGTRSRDGKTGPLNRGALKIARLCRAPIYVLQLRGTEKLFTPGKFFFNTRVNNTISLEIVDCIEPDSEKKLSLDMLETRIREILSSQIEGHHY
jgi:1-acyl-sn-glycerol-3-phosphate acyltransferase